MVVGTWKFTLLFIVNCTSMRLSQHEIENISKTVSWHSHCASFVITLGPAVLVQPGKFLTLKLACITIQGVQFRRRGLERKKTE